MIRLVGILREHRQFFIVITLLTLITTFPTIVYVFNTDVFWHPAGEHRDVPFWDIWYGKQFLTGQASAFYTNQIFYPEGVSLRFHLFFIPHIIVVNALSILLPISNAYSLAYLLIIFLCALSAYVYLSWLFKDKWIALLGAVVFGLSPHVVGHPFQPQIACIATIPLATYYFHRGIVENRRAHVLVAGLLTGLTTIIVFYSYVCLLILLGFVALALAVARYREKRFWLNVVLLILTISLSSLWRVYHLVTGSESLGEVAMWHGHEELGTALESYFVNYANPWFGEKLESILGIFSRFRSSASSYLGYLPLLLIGIGLMKPGTRRKMAPWAGLCALFLILRLGSYLNVSGVIHYNIPLPKLYLNQLLPEVFVSFWEADFFMAGALLPLAVLTCYGLVALRKQFAVMAKPGIVLALIAIVALEYHIPVESERIFPEGDGTFSWERLAFLDWLEEEEGDIRLINLPMGRRNAKVYGLYQALSGYPHATGAISRTPDSAFDYIRGNLLLNTWYEKQPIDCMTVDRGAFVSGLAQLEADGFSHVVVHNEFKYWDRIKDSFRELEPAYADDYVWIYRLRTLIDSCNEERTAHHSFASAYTDFLETNSRLDDSQGAAVVFTPTVRTADYFRRYLRYFTGVDRSVVTITGDDEATIKIQSSDSGAADAVAELEAQTALWLVNMPQVYDAEPTSAYQDWFLERFHFCRRFQEDERAVLDLYLREDFPCSSVDQGSEMEVLYDGGLRLHNVSYATNDDMLDFYLVWSSTRTKRYGFSLQFFAEDGEKALQYDNVISRQLLTAHEIDTSSLADGAYSIQLIVYDRETGASDGGRLRDSGQRFERELEVARLEVKA